jgi:transcriptional regulator of acetoin/glycerol metabolism
MTIGLHDVPRDLLSNNDVVNTFSVRLGPGSCPPLDEIEKRYVLFVLLRCMGNKTQACKILGIDRRTLYRKVARYTRDKARDV